jgi:diadenosine tetraphosphatase ApaH/serine/threonine PP2A family protein phosphatase
LRYAVFSDIHGNLDALMAVFAAMESEGIDVPVCLGDIVGYGPEPVECLREVQKRGSIVVAGNHDFAVTGKVSTSNFNVLAREAILWTRNHLSREDLEYLSGLPLVLHLDGLDVVHGTLYAPELFDYLQTSYDAYLSMERMRAPICFVGHSHVPVALVLDEIISYNLDPVVTVPPGGKVIVNVGSVGQPRDRDPRASFIIYDTESQTATRHRVHYDIDAVFSKVQAAGLPLALGERLRMGR